MKRLLLILLCIPNAIQAQETKTSIGFNFYPSYCDVYYITAGPEWNDFVETTKSLESGIFTFSGNIFFRHELNERFDVSWGIGYRDVGFSTTAEMPVIPTGTQEFLKTTFRQGYLQFPVSVNYNITSGLYVTGGLILSTLIDAQFHQEMAGISDNDPIYNAGDARDLREFQLSTTLGLGYSMKLSEQWRFYVEPMFAYGLFAQQFSEDFDRSPWRAGANFGVVHRF